MVLRPSEAEAQRLEGILREMGGATPPDGLDADGSDQEVWSRFYADGLHELPLRFNAHRGLLMSDDEWRGVHVLHAIAGWEYHKRSPAWLDALVHIYTAA